MALFAKKKELDLLTAEEVAKSPRQKLFPFFVAGLFILISLGIFVFVLILNLTAQASLASAKAEVTKKTTEWNQYKDVATNIKEILAKQTAHQTFEASYSSLDGKLDKLKSLLPEGVYLTNLTIDNTGKSTLTGASGLPENAYQFRDVLLQTKEVSEVNLTTVSKAGNVYTFTINFTIKDK